MRLGIVDLPEIAIIGREGFCTKENHVLSAVDGELHKRVLSGRNRSISEYGGTGGLEKAGCSFR